MQLHQHESHAVMPLTDYTRYADAQRHFSKQALWALFDLALQVRMPLGSLWS